MVVAVGLLLLIITVSQQESFHFTEASAPLSSLWPLRTVARSLLVNTTNLNTTTSHPNTTPTLCPLPTQHTLDHQLGALCHAELARLKDSPLPADINAKELASEISAADDVDEATGLSTSEACRHARRWCGPESVRVPLQVNATVETIEECTAAAVNTYLRNEHPTYRCGVDESARDAAQDSRALTLVTWKLDWIENIGLGNKMFMAARLLAIAKETGRLALMNNEPRNDWWKEVLKVVFWKWTLYDPDSMEAVIQQYQVGLEWKDVGTDPYSADAIGWKGEREAEVYGVPHDQNLRSWKYFHKYDRDVCEAFQLRPRHQALVEAKLNMMYAATSFPRHLPIVAVHVRRGDYLTWRDNDGAIVGSLDTLVFMVFSNDVEWVKQQSFFQSLRYVYYVPASNEPWIDIYLMAQARLLYYAALVSQPHLQAQHHIIANSTYSWWGAFLAECRRLYDRWWSIIINEDCANAALNIGEARRDGATAQGMVIANRWFFVHHNRMGYKPGDFHRPSWTVIDEPQPCPQGYVEMRAFTATEERVCTPASSNSTTTVTA
eukprot:jgi/Chlat1/4598/Chrsp290S04352